MNVVFTEDEMKKFLAEATRVSQVPVFALPLLFLFVFAVFVPPELCFPSVSVLLFPNSSLPGEEPGKFKSDPSVHSLKGGSSVQEPLQAFAVTFSSPMQST